MKIPRLLTEAEFNELDEGLQENYAAHETEDGTCYEATRAERGRQPRQHEVNRLLRRLAHLGFAAEIKPMASAAG